MPLESDGFGEAIRIACFAMKPIVVFLLLTMSALQAATPKISSIDVDAEAARVRKQIQEIQRQSISRDTKTQKQRELLEREIAKIDLSISNLANEIADGVKKGTDGKNTQEDKEAAAAAQQRRKHALANLRKLLDIVRSMNPRL